MKTLNEELAKITAEADEAKAANLFEKFCQKYGDMLPLPGQDAGFDMAMWQASEHVRLGKNDQSIVDKIKERLLAGVAEPQKAFVLSLKELVGAGKQAAIDAWQETLAAMSWQQLAPAGAMRGVGTQLVSLGTFGKEVGGANVQVNIGWLVDQDNLRLLVQAKDAADGALSDVELRVCEHTRGVVFSRKTNQDGAVVAPSVPVGPGLYHLQIVYAGQTAETPVFAV